MTEFPLNEEIPTQGGKATAILVDQDGDHYIGWLIRDDKKSPSAWDKTIQHKPRSVCGNSCYDLLPPKRYVWVAYDEKGMAWNATCDPLIAANDFVCDDYTIERFEIGTGEKVE